MTSLLQILGAIDLTTLASDDTVTRVRHLCRTARTPLPREVRDTLPRAQGSYRVGAVCVFPAFVPEALEALEGSGVPVATVAAGFPHGLSALSSRIREVAAAREAGAQEIDIVIRREWALTGNWKALFEEVRAFREAAGECYLKAILSTGELGALSRVGRAALTALMAGADFVKSSTGKERVNATLPAGLAMARALAHYQKVTGVRAGIKPAGGIRTSAEAYSWLLMAREMLGESATGPNRFRIGASSLLGDVIEKLRGLALT